MELLFTAITAVGASGILVLAVLVLRSPTRGAKEMAGALLAMGAWVGSAALESHVQSFDLYMAVVKTKYSAIALTPALTAIGVFSYVRRLRLRPALTCAVLALPAATIALTWTNEWHEWMWAHPPLDAAGQRSMRMPWGVWFWRVHVPSSYAFASSSLAVLARELWRPSRLGRTRVALLIAGVVLPLFVNALYTSGALTWRFGPTPIAITVSGLIFGWGFLRRGLFRLASVAYQEVFAQMRDGVLVTDTHGSVQLANPAALALCGRTEAELLDASVASALPADPRVHALLGESGSAHVDAVHANGRELEIAMSPLRDERGALAGRVLLLRNVTERERALAALRESEALVRGIVEHSPNGILHLRARHTPEGKLVDFTCAFANAAAATLLCHPVRELTGRPFKGAVHPHTAALFQAFRGALRDGSRCEIDRAFARGDGEHWLRFLAVPVGSDLVVTCVDATETKQRERAMQAAASEDPLTGLLNRRGLEADAPAVLSSPDGALRASALLYMDLDRFKGVNDELGHEVGDLVLCEFAARLQRATRGPDLLARLGGDEFVALLPETGLDGALWVARRVLEAAREPLYVDGAAIDCAPSIGVALAPEHGADLKALLQAADAAMYQAKQAQRGISVAAAT